MPQCPARQFENELVKRLSLVASRFLRPAIFEGGTISICLNYMPALQCNYAVPAACFDADLGGGCGHLLINKEFSNSRFGRTTQTVVAFHLQEVRAQGAVSPF
jgi:hypothetical protein